MKRLILVLTLAFFLAGCGAAAKQSEFWEHDSMYKNTDPMLFSWFGYKKPTKETGKKSTEENWWGKEVGKILE